MFQVAQRSFSGQKCILPERCLVLAHGAVTSTGAYENLLDASSIWAGELNGRRVGGGGRQKLVLYSKLLQFHFSSENHVMRIQLPSDTHMNLFSAHMLASGTCNRCRSRTKLTFIFAIATIIALLCSSHFLQKVSLCQNSPKKFLPPQNFVVSWQKCPLAARAVQSITSWKPSSTFSSVASTDFHPKNHSSWLRSAVN